VVTLDDHIDPGRYLGIIQLDVEGSESAAIQGARKTIERCAPVLILERDPDARFLDWFNQLGHRSRIAVHNNWVWSAEYSSGRGIWI
jgi:Methyltransferase FkbM domain